MLRFLLHSALALLYGLLLAVPVQWLWNHFVPGCLPLRPVGFWEAVGITVLGRLLHALRLLGFLLHTAFAALLGGWFLQWAWNNWLVPEFHLGTLGWLQAGGLVALLHLVLGSGHLWFHRHWAGHDWGHRDCREAGGPCREEWRERRRERREARRRRKEEWHELKDELKAWGRTMKREGRNLKDWADDAAPLGSHRHWRHFDAFWKDCGKEQFEAWLRERRSP
jgi:hypothetical protein